MNTPDGLQSSIEAFKREVATEYWASTIYQCDNNHNGKGPVQIQIKTHISPDTPNQAPSETTCPHCGNTTAKIVASNDLRVEIADR